MQEKREPGSTEGGKHKGKRTKRAKKSPFRVMVVSKKKTKRLIRKTESIMKVN